MIKHATKLYSGERCFTIPDLRLYQFYQSMHLSLILTILLFISSSNFVLSCVEQEKTTLRPGKVQK